MIPIGTDRPFTRRVVVTPVLVALNVAIMGMIWSFEMQGPAGVERANAIVKWMALKPAEPKWYEFITYAFMHGSVWHLAGNMIFLWTFGTVIEDRLGRGWFALFYLAGCAAAGGAHALIEESPCIGASGGVAAVAGMFLILNPNSQVRLLFLLGVASIMDVPAWWFVGLCIAKDLIFLSLENTGIAEWAHLGGYAMGMSIAVLLLLTRLIARDDRDIVAAWARVRRRKEFHRVVRTEMLNRFQKITEPEQTEESADLARRRAELAAAVSAERLADARRLYAGLIGHHGKTPKACVLSAKSQLTLANALFAAQEHRLAADAYEGYVLVYPFESETPRVRVMLGLICARKIGNRERARSALDGVREAGLDTETADLMAELKREVGLIEERS